MFETFDHTADLGLRARAPDLNQLFGDAAQALVAAIVEEPAAIELRQRVQMRIEGTDREYLLFDWLKAILNRFESEQWLPARIDVQVGPAGLEAELWGEPYDPVRHIPAHEVKAITYHGLKVEQTADGWLAEVIVDI